MKYILTLMLLATCNQQDDRVKNDQPKEPRTIEVCDGCVRDWYSQGTKINTIPWGFEGCEADGNVYRYEDRDGTSATNFYPSNPGSSYVIRCTTKIIEY